LIKLASNILVLLEESCDIYHLARKIPLGSDANLLANLSTILDRFVMIQ